MGLSRAVFVLLLLPCVACATTEDAGLDPSQEDSGGTGMVMTSAESTGHDTHGDASTGADSSGGSDSGILPGGGLPCDVDELLTTYCRSCHGDPLVGTTFALLTRDDLLAPAPTDPATNLGEKSVDRMNNDLLPMPPAPAARPSADEIAVFSDWVAAGMPAGDCNPVDVPSPFDADPVCTSNQTWNGGNEEDPRMRPGYACNDCHDQMNEGPIFKIAGTVYPSGHEPDDCNGLAAVTVQVTDANNQVVELQTNSAGNFMLSNGDAPPGFAAPYLVKVVSDLGERVMATPVANGDCNLCHTQDGDQDALGRIVAPW